MLDTALRRIVAGAVTALGLALAVFAAPASADDRYMEPFRPQFHFTPAQNWMNDPNGLVYHRGEYHLFYQHNPFGNTWGHMSWGHAVSRDLVHWEHLPVAIAEEGDEAIFSGSAVVDENNTSGFGTRSKPPMVAIYTSAYPDDQKQSLAYSTDRGRTWTKYAGNPVLDDPDRDFRDPKVFWYAPEREWRMVVVKALQRKVAIYGSSDLKQWRHLSDFGPANAVGGAWECPDLFPLKVDGKTKWVMLVSLNPGGIAGGSGMQYFIGDFDGTTYRADNIAGDDYTPPAGTLFEGFEGTDYGGWTATGDAFGARPAPVDAPAHGVSGFVGDGFADSFHGGDGPTGTLTSPTFPISRAYLNFLVGGGAHAHVAGTTDDPPPPGTVFADFESATSYGEGWTATGTLADTAPAAGTIGDQQPVTGYEGARLVNTFLDHDLSTGRIISPAFQVASDYINLLVGGGFHPYPGDTGNPPTAVNLVVDGQVVRTATGEDAERLNWVAWDVREFAGQTARIDIVDENTGGWGHINVDQITFANAPAQRRSNETAVNLLVDGEVVRTTSGQESERLDWASWRVDDLIGRQAQIQLVDRNTGGWGHIMADHFTFADAPAQSVLQRSSWVDYGKDYYAAVSWNGVPDGRRVMIGWMSNWQYANQIPTSPWRSAMSVPREVRLRRIDGRTQLVQSPVRELRRLRGGRAFKLHDRTIEPGSRRLTGRGASGKALEIEAAFKLRDADRFGLKVRTGAGEETVIGYDATAGELYVDRSRSGNVGFNGSFAGVQRAPLAARDGKVELRVLVDWSSVEVFADRGQIAITDQIFPSAESDGIELFAEGGAAKLDSMSVQPLRSSWRSGRAGERDD